MVVVPASMQAMKLPIIWLSSVALMVTLLRQFLMVVSPVT
jgi:hypothetical protein